MEAVILKVQCETDWDLYRMVPSSCHRTCLQEEREQ